MDSNSQNSQASQSSEDGESRERDSMPDGRFPEGASREDDDEFDGEEEEAEDEGDQTRRIRDLRRNLGPEAGVASAEAANPSSASAPRGSYRKQVRRRHLRVSSIPSADGLSTSPSAAAHARAGVSNDASDPSMARRKAAAVRSDSGREDLRRVQLRVAEEHVARLRTTVRTLRDALVEALTASGRADLVETVASAAITGVAATRPGRSKADSIAVPALPQRTTHSSSSSSSSSPSSKQQTRAVASLHGKSEAAPRGLPASGTSSGSRSAVPQRPVPRAPAPTWPGQIFHGPGASPSDRPQPGFERSSGSTATSGGSRRLQRQDLATAVASSSSASSSSDRGNPQVSAPASENLTGLPTETTRSLLCSRTGTDAAAGTGSSWSRGPNDQHARPGPDPAASPGGAQVATAESPSQSRILPKSSGADFRDAPSTWRECDREKTSGSAAGQSTAMLGPQAMADAALHRFAAAVGDVATVSFAPNSGRDLVLKRALSMAEAMLAGSGFAASRRRPTESPAGDARGSDRHPEHRRKDRHETDADVPGDGAGIPTTRAVAGKRAPSPKLPAEVSSGDAENEQDDSGSSSSVRPTSTNSDNSEASPPSAEPSPEPPLVPDEPSGVIKQRAKRPRPLPAPGATFRAPQAPSPPPATRPPPQSGVGQCCDSQPALPPLPASVQQGGNVASKRARGVADPTARASAHPRERDSGARVQAASACPDGHSRRLGAAAEDPDYDEDDDSDLRQMGGSLASGMSSSGSQVHNMALPGACIQQLGRSASPGMEGMLRAIDGVFGNGFVPGDSGNSSGSSGHRNALRMPGLRSARTYGDASSSNGDRSGFHHQPSHFREALHARVSAPLSVGTGSRLAGCNGGDVQPPLEAHAMQQLDYHRGLLLPTGCRPISNSPQQASPYPQGLQLFGYPGPAPGLGGTDSALGSSASLLPGTAAMPVEHDGQLFRGPTPTSHPVMPVPGSHWVAAPPWQSFYAPSVASAHHALGVPALHAATVAGSVSSGQQPAMALVHPLNRWTSHPLPDEASQDRVALVQRSAPPPAASMTAQPPSRSLSSALSPAVPARHLAPTSTVRASGRPQRRAAAVAAVAQKQMLMEAASDAAHDNQRFAPARAQFATPVPVPTQHSAVAGAGGGAVPEGAVVYDARQLATPGHLPPVPPPLRKPGSRKGKLDADERARVKFFLQQVIAGKLVVYKGELAKQLRDFVNPDRAQSFYEKLISRRKLNHTLLPLLQQRRQRASTLDELIEAGMRVAAGGSSAMPSVGRMPLASAVPGTGGMPGIPATHFFAGAPGVPMQAQPLYAAMAPTQAHGRLFGCNPAPSHAVPQRPMFAPGITAVTMGLLQTTGGRAHSVAAPPGAGKDVVKEVDLSTGGILPIGFSSGSSSQ